SPMMILLMVAGPGKRDQRTGGDGGEMTPMRRRDTVAGWGMSLSATAQQANIAAIAQFDGFGDPAVDALALAAVSPFGGAVVADLTNQGSGQLPAACARALAVEHL